MLRSKAVHQRKSAVSPEPETLAWNVTVGKRIAAGLFNF
jgi:hypothetical protein